MAKIKYGYYPGCSLESTAKEYDLSMHVTAKLLDVELAELHDWNCCGASSGHCTNYELSLALPARNLAIAEKAGLDEVKKRVKKPLKGLKLAAYYGCYLVRPPEVTQFDNPEQPMLMDNLLAAF